MPWLIALSLVFVFLVADASAGIISVRTDGTGDADTITGGIFLAAPGDTVDIGGGTYRENVVVEKTLTVLGAGSASCVVDGDGMGSAVRVTASNVVLRGLWITNGFAETGGGLYCVGDGVSLRECRFSGNRAEDGGAIYIRSDTEVDVSENTIDGNECTGSPRGGVIVLSAPGVVERNRVCDNFGSGIVTSAFTGSRVDIVGNLVRGNREGIAAIALEGRVRSTCAGNIVAENDGITGGIVAEVVGASATVRENLCFENTGMVGGTAGLHAIRGASVENNIVFGGQGAHLVYVSGDVLFSCNDVFSADGDDLYHGPDHTGIGGNFSADPSFCDLVSFQLAGGSPCLPGNHPDGIDCGLVGPNGQGCDPVPTFKISWGDVKRRYR